MIRRMVGMVVWGTAVLLFLWTVVLKIVSRVAARFGHSTPCPASLSWLVDNPIRQRYMQPVLDWIVANQVKWFWNLVLAPVPSLLLLPIA